MVVVESNGAAAMASFSRHVLGSRLFMAFGSLLILSMAGASYLFGIYSGEIKSSLGYDQTTLNLLSFFKDLGGNLAIISGLINEVTPVWFVLSLGILFNFFGYFMMWLAVSGRIDKPNLWQMCLYLCVGANSQSFANTGATVTCVKNFPENRGILLGHLKGAIGLSGAIFTQLYHAFYGNNAQSLILLIAWLPVAVTCVFLRTIRIMKPDHQREKQNERKFFHNLLFLSLGLAGFLMVIIILQQKLKFNKFEYGISAGTVLVLVFSPVVLVVRGEYNVWRSKKVLAPPQVATEAETKTQPAIPTGVETNQENIDNNVDSCFKNVFKPPERGEDHTILQAVFSVDMLVLFAATTFGVGGTLTAIDNLGQIGKALGYPSSSITTFVSLVSIWNYLGRVTSGFASEIFLAKHNCPRPLMLTAVLLLSCLGHLLIAFGVPKSLYFSSMLMGFCFGAQWPLILAIISELFGLKYYSTLYNLGAGASPVGLYILNVRVAGNLYDKEALRQMAVKGLVRKPGQDLTCVGVECYKAAFLIITAATFVGCLVSLVLVMRTRKFYRGDIYKRFKEQVEEANNESAA